VSDTLVAVAEAPTLEFRKFPKVPRLNALTMCITEKLDGTNACVRVDEHGRVSAQSRNRVITPAADNYGFAGWVLRNEDDLRNLGEGYHFGEWWGLGIQRGYGLKEKRFSLFNVRLWNDEIKPACCHVVPVLYEGAFEPEMIRHEADLLRFVGSVAAPGWIPVEGVMIYVPELGTYIKHPHDPHPKGPQADGA
jgi:hypothetical protein